MIQPIVAAILVMLMSSVAQAEDDLPTLAANTKPSVVHLRVFDTSGREVGSGSGFFVDGARVATNDHVVAKAATVVAKLSDGREWQVAGLLANDEERDIAVIQLIPEGDVPKSLKLGSTGDLRQGEEVVVIGSPRGLAGTLSAGIVSAIRGQGVRDRPEFAKSWAIQITAAISPGSSGSPIMLRDGTVVAVAVGIVGQGGNLGFGVDIQVVKDMLSAMGPDTSPRPFAVAAAPSTLLRNLLISGVFFALIAAAFFVPGLVKQLRRKQAS